MSGGGGSESGGAGASGLFGSLSASVGGGNAFGVGTTVAPSSGSFFNASGLGTGSSLFQAGCTSTSGLAGASGAVFGNASSGTLFGARPASANAQSVAAPAAQPSSSGLTGSSNSSATTPGGALFGSGTPASGTDKGIRFFGFGAGSGTPASSTAGFLGNAITSVGSSPNASQGGLFGGTTGTTANTSDSAKEGLFGGITATNRTQDGGKAGGLFGAISTTGTTPDASKGGMFGGSASATSSKPDSAQGGLFGSLSAGSTELAKPAGGIFVGVGSSNIPPATTATEPTSETTGAAPAVAKGPGFFGSLGDTAKPVAGGGLFGSGTAAAGGTVSGNEGKDEGLFGNTTTSNSAPPQSEQGDSQPSKATNGLSLFASNAAGSSSNTSNIFTSGTKPVAAATTEQKGTGATAAATSAHSSGEQKTSSGQGVFESSSSVAGQGAGSLFGSKAGGSTESAAAANVTTATGVAVQGAPILPPEEVALETMQHERMDDLLANWERRLQRKVGQFDELAQEVASVEASLIAQSKALASISEEQQRVHRRQVFVGEAIDMIEQQQHDLSSLLASIESNLLAKLSPQEQRSLCSTVEQSMSRRVLDIDAQMDELASAITVTARKTQPEPIAAISQVLAVHQAALQSATQQCAKLEQCLKNLQRHAA